jgi:radical SAM superfamily enzyme YgiQ (UPF0313 family)
LSHRHRVLLYNPRADFHTLPLGLLAVGSALDPERFEVRIVDGRLEGDPLATLSALVDHRTLCLGMGVLTGAPLADALAVSRGIRARFPDLPIIWGGWHASLFGEACLEEPSVDMTVRGQGEQTFAEILERLIAQASPKGVAGCSWRDAEGRVHREVERPPASVEDLPAHDYRLLPVTRYFAHKGRRQLDYVASQGCFWRCAFCADPRVYGRTWSGLSPARMLHEISGLWQEYRFGDLNFQDETFFTHASRALEFAEGLAGLDLPFTWAATMRADQGDRLRDADFGLLARSGLRRVLVGVESGDPDLLRWMQKDSTIDQVLTTLEKCRRHGIAAELPFIVGFPGEAPESVDATLSLARQLRRMAPDFQVRIFFFKPYPGAPISEAAERAGLALPRSLEDWSRFDIYTLGSWLDPGLARRIQRFDHYQRRGWDPIGPLWRRPFAALARWRCEREAFALPWEMWLARARNF